LQWFGVEYDNHDDDEKPGATGDKDGSRNNADADDDNTNDRKAILRWSEWVVVHTNGAATGIWVAPSLHARISWKTTLHVLDSALVWGLR
jgi:hypothetical protein